MLLPGLAHEKMVVLSCELNFPFPLDGSLWENPAAMLQGCPVQSLIGGIWRARSFEAEEPGGLQSWE